MLRVIEVFGEWQMMVRGFIWDIVSINAVVIMFVSCSSAYSESLPSCITNAFGQTLTCCDKHECLEKALLTVGPMWCLLKLLIETWWFGS